MKKIADLLKGREKDVWSVSPDATVSDALTKMSEKNIGAVLVMKERELHGIFSERDYARMQLKGLSPKRTLVSRVIEPSQVGRKNQPISSRRPLARLKVR